MAIALAVCAAGVALASAGPASVARADGYAMASEPWGLGTPGEPCVVCHTLQSGEAFRYAPTLAGIVGADKARERDWYGYSQALMTMGGVWTEEDLNAFLADARRFAPGTTKSIRVTDAEERARIIDFLKTLKP